jgi:uncharacterized membrane protein
LPAAAVAVLTVVVAALGPALTAIPTNALRLVIGTVLLVFGVQWLRKAVLRAGGVTALHDEEAIFQRKLAVAQRAASQRRGTVPDWYGFTLAFQGVLLEGTEVAFIVLTFGSNQHAIPLAPAAPTSRIAAPAAEGAGARWPGSDAALLVLLPGIAVLGLLLVAGLLRQDGARDRRTAAASPTQRAS